MTLFEFIERSDVRISGGTLAAAILVVQDQKSQVEEARAIRPTYVGSKGQTRKEHTWALGQGLEAVLLDLGQTFNVSAPQPGLSLSG
jgi:hypothetical protein